MHDPVLIVGAGIVGLTLGQALKKRNIPFAIYERDAHPDSRGQGWAITLHWALQYIQSLLPQETLQRIQDCQVDPEVARNDNGNFLFINLATGEPRFKIPPSSRWRVNREKMRRALLVGIEEHVHWGKRVDRVSFTEDGRPQIVIDGEEAATGKLVVGIEGSRSTVRRFLRPDEYRNDQLPVRFTGVAVDLTTDDAAPLRAMDPLLFQGCHPDTGVFFWFSILETPATHPTGLYRVQINMSWVVHSADDEVPDTDEGRLANMKKRAEGFTPFLLSAVQRIPDETPVLEITLADWECLPWGNYGGRVTLAGDAAHAMVMYRGEAANHGLLDIFHLVEAIASIYAGADQSTAIDKYENEMRNRTAPAVRLSRQACMEAHAWDQLTEGCAILSRRKIAGS
ncbi:FAD-dependent oxidoreductase [Aspergillus stella-maris]|uniref:FAD-dependent oxidoreductase n=1 Tax=Aspergillus stella-maris TaxID=1810926 RepID=UPI003CCE4885